MFAGLKTYLVVAAAVLSAILGWFTGEMTLLQSLQAVGLALGLGGARAVIKTGEVLASLRSGADPRARVFVTYAGTALAVLSAIIAALNGEQDAVATISAILGALGLNFLGVGAKNTVAT